MLEITIPEQELFDEGRGEFVTIKEQKLQLEHSLISISKWESKWKKPFLDNTPDGETMTAEQLLDYFRCMCITPKVDPMVFEHLPMNYFIKIKDYISNEQTATTIYDRRQNRPFRNEKITSELIYYWMIYHGIPFECEKWPLSRLLTLIRICSIKGANEQMSMKEIFADNRRLHNMRKGGRH